MQIQKLLRYLSWILLCCTVAALGLLVLHPPRAVFQTAETLDQVLPKLKERGYKVVNLSELMTYGK